MKEQEESLLSLSRQQGHYGTIDVADVLTIMGLRDERIKALTEQLNYRKPPDRPELRKEIDQEALAGIHRVIPAFKEDCRGKPIDAYLTSASINKILDQIEALIKPPDRPELREKIAQMLYSKSKTFADLMYDVVKRYNLPSDPRYDSWTTKWGDWDSLDEIFKQIYRLEADYYLALIDKPDRGD